MPVPTIKCSLCGVEVTKRRSTALPNGTRACETHPESIAAADASRKKVVNNMATVEDRRKKRWNQMFRPEPEVIKPLIPKCFCCGREGLHEADYRYRILMATQKMELQGKKMLPWKVEDGAIEHNDEYVAALRENMKSPEHQGDNIYVCLFMADIKQNPKMNAHLSYHARMAADLTGFAMVCPACIKKYGVKEPEKPPIDFDKLTHWTAIAEMMKPRLQELAAREMAG